MVSRQRMRIAEQGLAERYWKVRNSVKEVPEASENIEDEIAGFTNLPNSPAHSRCEPFVRRFRSANPGKEVVPTFC